MKDPADDFGIDLIRALLVGAAVALAICTAVFVYIAWGSL